MWPCPHLVLDPGHQVVDVARRGALDRDLHHVAVCPVVLKIEKYLDALKKYFWTFFAHLVLGAGGHDGAGGVRAAVGQRPHQHRDLVDEVHHVVRHPPVMDGIL